MTPRPPHRVADVDRHPEVHHRPDLIGVVVPEGEVAQAAGSHKQQEQRQPRHATRAVGPVKPGRMDGRMQETRAWGCQIPVGHITALLQPHTDLARDSRAKGSILPVTRVRATPGGW